MGILVAVLLGFLLALPIPWLHRRGAASTGPLIALIPLALTVYLARYVPRIAQEGPVRVEIPWVHGMDADLSFYVDGLSLLFALLICGIGTAIFFYSGEYIKKHEHGGRFYAYMLFFMASMLGLVLADNVFLLYVFFELTSIASFLLIGFEHSQKEARRAAWQALIVTNAGGLCLLASVLLLGDVVDSYEISQLLGEGEAIRAADIYLPAMILMLLAGFTKSAQFPFYFWLPNAMAAPTPVSAYLHSATMVKAGIYVLARFSPVLGGTNAWILAVSSAGALTMVLAGYLALRYTDLKRLLAYSTIMALGFLTMLLGVGSEGAVLGCMTFIVVHALYKASLFMVVGILDHEAGSKDANDLGGLRRAFPITFAAALVAALSMAGIPPFLGFVGKETIYDALLNEAFGGYMLLVASVLSNAAIVAAAGVVALRPFVGQRRHPEQNLRRVPVGLWLPAAIVAIPGLIFGLAPGLFSRRLVEPAAGAILGDTVSEHIALWHGVTPAFGWSIATLAIGIALFAVWGQLQRSVALQTYASWLGEGLDKVYERGLHALMQIADWMTQKLQNGILSHYVAISIGAGAVLVAVTLLRSGLPSPPDSMGDTAVHEAAVAALLAAAAVAVITVKHRLTAVLALSVAGFSVALIYLFFGAPDTAMAQLLVETLTVILVALALIDMPKVYRERVPDRWRYRNLVIAGACGTLVTLLMLSILEMPFDTSLGDYYAQNSLGEGHGRNVVTVILVDFRALDTLGEITVLVVAGLSAYALIRWSGVTKGRTRTIREEGEPRTEQP